MTTHGLRWGLIGASDIAATRMIPAMRAAGQEVLACVSSSAEHAASYADRNGIKHATSDLDSMLARDDIDAVYISSTNDRHRVQAEAAAAAGKHVLCEKPIATSLDDAFRVVDACAEAGVVLAVNHHLPGAGTHRMIRELVHSGAVGRVLAVSVRHAVLLPERLRGWRLGDAPGAGVVLDITCHDASVINPLLGSQAVEAVALSARQGSWDCRSEDAAMSIIRYADDVLVQTHDAFTSPYSPTALEVHGTDGSVVASDVMTQDPIGHVLLHDKLGTREIDVPDRRPLYEIVLSAFEAAVLEDGQPTASGADGLRAYAVAEAVLQSARSGQPIPVPVTSTATSKQRNANA